VVEIANQLDLEVCPEDVSEFGFSYSGTHEGKRTLWKLENKEFLKKRIALRFPHPQHLHFRDFHRHLKVSSQV
jgi:hypothetical protein